MLCFVVWAVHFSNEGIDGSMGDIGMPVIFYGNKRFVIMDGNM